MTTPSEQPDSQPRIYVASKTKYAENWRQLRSIGLPIISTWIDEAGEGESKSYAELSARCIEEVSSATGLVLYSRKEDELKGALIEVGVALAVGIPVYNIGGCPSISRVFREHPLWVEVADIEEARRIWSTRPAVSSLSRQRDALKAALERIMIGASLSLQKEEALLRVEIETIARAALAQLSTQVGENVP